MGWFEHFPWCRFTLFQRRYPLGLGSSGVGGFFRRLIRCLLSLFFPLSDQNRRVDKLV
jgi:hypothetical protein